MNSIATFKGPNDLLPEMLVCTLRSSNAISDKHVEVDDTRQEALNYHDLFRKTNHRNLNTATPTATTAASTAPTCFNRLNATLFRN